MLWGGVLMGALLASGGIPSACGAGRPGCWWTLRRDHCGAGGAARVPQRVRRAPAVLVQRLCPRAPLRPVETNTGRPGWPITSRRLSLHSAWASRRRWCSTRRIAVVPAWWWLASGVIFAGLIVGLARLAPVVLLPLFFSFSPLGRDDLRARLEALARAGRHTGCRRVRVGARCEDRQGERRAGRPGPDAADHCLGHDARAVFRRRNRRGAGAPNSVITCTTTSGGRWPWSRW